MGDKKRKRHHHLSVDPADRYRDIAATAGRTSPATVSQDEISRLISGTCSQEEQVAVLAGRVAERSALTLDQATNVVTHALPSVGSTQERASSVGSAITEATASADIELSDPVMLAPAARLASTVAFFVLAAGSLLLTWRLALRAGSHNGVSSSTYIAVAIVGGLCLLGALVLVMGYKNVTIKGSGGGPSAGHALD
jgi:hypothetical protein